MQPAKQAIGQPANTFDLMVCATLKSRVHTAANRRQARQLTWRWIGEKWPRLVSTGMNLEAGRFERSCPGARLIVTSANQDDWWMAEVTAVTRDSRQWQTRVLVADNKDFDVLAIQAGCSQMGTAPAAVAPPKLLTAWADALEVHDASEPAFGEPWWVQDAAGAVDLLDHLLSAERALPVIMLANKGLSRHYGVDPEALAKTMQGMAHVACVTQAARVAMARRLGARLAPFPGAARIYGPGLQEDDPPESHPLVRPPEPGEGDRARTLMSFRQMIIRVVCASSARASATCAL